MPASPAGADEWAINGNEEGAENLVAYQKTTRRAGYRLTHTIIQPTIDKSHGDVPLIGDTVALHKVDNTAHGILVRGSRVLATLAPFADEIAVYPAVPLTDGTDAHAVSFCIRMDTPGLKFLCRDSFSRAGNRFDHPLSSRFDEQDAFVIFDDVEVPRDRVFIDANLAVYNSVMAPQLVAQHHAADHDPGADQAGIRLGPRDAHGRGDQRHRNRRRSRCWARSGRYRRIHPRRDPCRRARRVRVWQRRVAARRAAAGRAARDAAALVSAGERDHPPDRLAQSFHRADRGAIRRSRRCGRCSTNTCTAPARSTPSERARIFRLAWDFTGSALASRNEQYERFYLGSGGRNFQVAQMFQNRDRANRLVDRFLREV